MSKAGVAWEKVIKCTPLVDELFDEIEDAIKNGKLKTSKLNDDVEKFREITKTIGFLMCELKEVGYKLNYNDNPKKTLNRRMTNGTK